MSSRNAYLTADERPPRPCSHARLLAAGDAAARGESDAAVLRARDRRHVAREPPVRLDYAEVVDARTLEPVDIVDTDTLVAVAAFVGKDPPHRQRHH